MEETDGVRNRQRLGQEGDPKLLPHGFWGHLELAIVDGQLKFKGDFDT